MAHGSYHYSPQAGEKIALPISDGLAVGGHVSLDALRVLALCALVAYHVALLFSGEAHGVASRALLFAGRMGYVGTDVLLALAGFLAVGAFRRAGSTGKFLQRRALRVLPGLAAFLLLYLLLVPALLRDRAQTLPNYGDLSRARSLWPLLATMTANFVMVAGARIGAALEPMLTLGVGAQLTVCLALLLIDRRRLWIGAASALVAGFVLRLVWLHADPYVPYAFPLCRADGFFFGALAADLLRRQQTRQWLLGHRCQLLALTGIGLLAIVVVTKGLSLTSPIMKIVGYPALGLWCASLVTAASQVTRCPRPFTWIACLAPVGFAAYLVKLPVAFVVLAAFPSASMPRFLCLALVACWAVAAVFYVAVERPLSRLAARVLGGGHDEALR